MPQSNPSSQQRRPTLPRKRPSIHRSRNDANKFDTQELLTMSRDAVLTTPESSFNPEDVSDEEVHDSGNTESEDDEKNSEISHYSDEDSIDDSKDESEYKNEQHRIPVYVNKPVPLHDIRQRFNKKKPFPNYTNESVSTEEINYMNKSKSVTNERKLVYILLLCLAVVVFCIPIVVSITSLTTSSEEKFDIKLIKKNFTTQDEDLWIAFESGVQDVVDMSRPSTFILLYKKEAEGTLKDLVYQLSKYAACNITDCSQDPIEISGAELNSTEIMKDYGIIIENYRDTLKEKGVMIIKNLENVPGISAQAFHSFCDEFTPLVDKSLIIFTMKVDKLPDSKDRMKFVEEYFRHKWTDIKVDTLNALITRITSMVIEVRA